MRKIPRWIRLASLVGVGVLAIACGDDGPKASKYPGELGAFCKSKADCDGEGAFCTRDISDDENDLAFCTIGCTQDADCGDQGVCVHSSIDVYERVCMRRCETTEFCTDLSSEYNACDTWRDESPDKICGYRG